MSGTATGRVRELPHRRILTLLEVSLLLHAARNTFERTVVLVLYATGERLSELVRFRRADIHWRVPDSYDAAIAVRMPVGAVDRLVSFSNQAAGVLYVYEQQQAYKTALLFEDAEGSPLRPSAIRNLLKELGERAGIGPITGHALRKAIAAHRLANTGELEGVRKELLGWSGVNRHDAVLRQVLGAAVQT